MTTFFTVMIVTFSINNEEAQMRLLYTSAMACGNAIEAVEAAMDPALTIEMVQCKRSNLISGSPRPKPRPTED